MPVLHVIAGTFPRHDPAVACELCGDVPGLVWVVAPRHPATQCVSLHTMPADFKAACVSI